MKGKYLLLIFIVVTALITSGCYVPRTSAQTTPQTDEPQSAIPEGFYKVVQSTNTFREADLGSAKIDRIEPGSLVEVIGSAGAFAQIKFSENTAWIKKNQVEDTKVPKVVKTLGRIRGKEAPSDLASDLEILDSGRLLTVKAASGDWLLVKISENRGWILSGALEPLGVTTKTAVFEAVESLITLRKANLREKANTNSNILKTLPPDTRVEQLGKSGEWFRVKYLDTTGYIHEDLLSNE